VSGLLFFIPFATLLPSVAMSSSSKAKKVKPKDTVRELKLVHSISRRGTDVLKTEEVKTPKKKTASTSRHNGSSSPIKRPKLEPFNPVAISGDLEELDMSGKRCTLVLLSQPCLKALSKKFQGQNDYLGQFLDHESSYLNHLLNLELPSTNTTCSLCEDAKPRFRCRDCYGPHWWCQACLIKLHILHPFHRPQEWKEGSFENVSLCDLGYVFTLGHSGSGLRCPEDDNLFGDRTMTLIHVNGLFEHCVRFCRCEGAIPQHEQLFNHRLFSSTFDRPETAFTLDVLDYYWIDAMECKTSAQSFFQKLRRVANNAFPDILPVSLPLYVQFATIYLSSNSESIHGIN